MSVIRWSGKRRAQMKSENPTLSNDGMRLVLSYQMKHQCKHCGTTYRRKTEVEGFCCTGCAHVYQLIRAEGLGEFYGSQHFAVKPVGERPFEARDYAWVRALMECSGDEAGVVRAVLRIDGMSCIGCIWLVERLCQRADGLLRAKASLTHQLLQLEWKAGACELTDLFKQLQSFGYTVSAYQGRMILSAWDWRMLLSLVFAGNSLLLQMVLASEYGGGEVAKLFQLLVWLCVLLNVLIIAQPYCMGLWRSWRTRRFGEEVLLATGLIALLFASLLKVAISGLPLLQAPALAQLPAILAIAFLPDWCAGRLGLVDRLWGWSIWMGVLFWAWCVVSVWGWASWFSAGAVYAVVGMSSALGLAFLKRAD